MKKIIIAAIVMMACLFGLSAQEETESVSSGSGFSSFIDFTNFGGPVESNSIIVDAAIAIDNGTFHTLGYYIPRITLSGEYAIQLGPCPFGFGLEIDYMSNRTNDFYDANGYHGNRLMQYHNNLYFALIVDYHVNLPALEDFDFYLGPRLGLRLDIIYQEDYHFDTLTGQWPTTKSYVTKPHFYGGGVIGATWYLGDMLGINAEVGFPVLVRLGATIKFKL